MLRGIVFLALVGGAGFSAWGSFQDSSRPPLDWLAGEVHAMVTQWETAPAPVADVQTVKTDGGAIVETAALTSVVSEPVSALTHDRFVISQDTLAAITCGPWDISEVGIETILDEMMRRGWTPPSQAKALEVSQPVNGIVIEPLDPEAIVMPAPNEEEPEAELASF